MADIEQARPGRGVLMFFHDAQGYCTGMSYPAKGTILAPSSTCRSYSGVRVQIAMRVSPIRPCRLENHPASHPPHMRPLMPPLSFRLRSLSLRRTRLRLSPESFVHTVLGPESFRGGCSFGTKTHARAPRILPQMTTKR